MNRRDFLKLSTAAAGAAFASQIVPGISYASKEITNQRGPVSDLEVKAMVFDISYVTQILSSPKSGEKTRFWIPLPKSDVEQEITRLSIESPVPFNINEEPKFRNQMVFVGPENLKAGGFISVAYRIRRKTIGTVQDRNEDISKHSVLTGREKADGAIAAFVKRVVGSEKDPVKVGRRVFDALVETLTYDKTIPGCGMGNSVWTFRNKAGKCDDFHALFRTMMISKGVPVKWEQGIALSYPSAITTSGEMEGDCTGAHCWVRFHAGDGNWVPVDVSEANKRPEMREFFFGNLSPNRFKVSSGRDLILEPAQGGEPLNSFPYTHAEAGGIPLIYGHHFRNRIRFEVVRIEV